VPVKFEYALPTGSMLHQYRIQQTLGGGGFSIVYLGRDTLTNRKVVIKEYLPTSQATRAEDESVETLSAETASTFRQGMKRFFDEATALAKVNHPNIVRVTDFFRENNTVYLVMDHEEGRDLRWHIKRHKGRLSERFVRAVFPPLLDGLRELHRRNLLHLDIKPANILLRSGGRPLLLDFGATQAAYANNRLLGPHTLTLGFAPLEQHKRGHVGPWTDLYAVGATMYACLSGKAPPPAPERAQKDSYKPVVRAFAGRYSRPLLEAVDWCLTLNQIERPQSVDELLAVFAQPLPRDEPPGKGLLELLGSKLSWPRK
jgi:serine/threonine protein kinase